MKNPEITTLRNDFTVPAIKKNSMPPQNSTPRRIGDNFKQPSM